MKTKLLIVVLFLLSIQQINAQEYIPIAVEGAHWIVIIDYIDTVEPVDGIWEYYASGDTVVNDISYMKIYHRSLVITQSGPPFQASGPYQLSGLLRDDTVARKVYAIRFFSQMLCPMNEEYLLFDFSLTIGDTADLCMIPGYINFIVQDIYVWPIMGFPTRVFEGVELFYEGMGSNYGLFEDMFAPVKSQSRYIYHTFLYYYCRETPCDLLVSTNNITESPLLEIYPNPTSNTVFIKCGSRTKINSVSIFNVLGQKEIQISSNLKQIDISTLEDGLYIIEIEIRSKKFRYKIIKE